MRGKLIIPVLLLLTGCSNDFSIDNEANKARLQNVIENEEKSKSSISSSGKVISYTIENRKLDSIPEIVEIIGNRHAKKIHDFIYEITTYEEQILDNYNNEVPPKDDEGNYLYENNPMTLEDVKGNLTEYHFFSKKDGSIEQYFIYDNNGYIKTLSVLWIGDELYALE